MGIFGKGRPKKYIFSEKRGKKPPSAPGVYRIRDAQNKVVYVGETVDLNKRMHEHVRKTGKLRAGESFEYKTAKPGSTSAERRRTERQKIAKYRPARNASSGGEGRPPKSG